MPPRPCEHASAAHHRRRARSSSVPLIASHLTAIALSSTTSPDSTTDPDPYPNYDTNKVVSAKSHHCRFDSDHDHNTRMTSHRSQKRSSRVPANLSRYRARAQTDRPATVPRPSMLQAPLQCQPTAASPERARRSPPDVDRRTGFAARSDRCPTGLLSAWRSEAMRAGPSTSATSTSTTQRHGSTGWHASRHLVARSGELFSAYLDRELFQAQRRVLE